MPTHCLPGHRHHTIIACTASAPVPFSPASSPTTTMPTSLPSPPPPPLDSKLMRIHAVVAGRHTRHGQLLPLEVYLEEGLPLVGAVRRGLARCAARPCRRCRHAHLPSSALHARAGRLCRVAARLQAARPRMHVRAAPAERTCRCRGHAGASPAGLPLCHAVRAVRAEHARLCVLWHRGLRPALPQGKAAAVGDFNRDWLVRPMLNGACPAAMASPAAGIVSWRRCLRPPAGV